MTIENQTSQVVYTTDGIAAAFPFAFFAPVGSIVVEVNDGESTTLINKGDYTVTYNDPEGGTVTFPQAPQANLKLFISRIVEFIQEVDIQNQQRFYPEVIEGALDYLTMQTQQLKTETDRAVKALPGADVQEFVDSIFAAEKRAVDFALISKNWAESPTAPGDLDSKSSKTWALESAASATSAALSSAAAGVASTRLVVATFAELATMYGYTDAGGRRALSPGDLVFVLTLNQMYKVRASTADDDGLIDYTGSGGVVYEALPGANGRIDIRAFGCDLTGSTFSTAAFQLAFDSRKPLSSGMGLLKLDDTILLEPGFDFEGPGGVANYAFAPLKLHFEPATKRDIFNWKNPQTESYEFGGGRLSGFTVRGFGPGADSCVDLPMLYNGRFDFFAFAGIDRWLRPRRWMDTYAKGGAMAFRVAGVHFSKAGSIADPASDVTTTTYIDGYVSQGPIAYLADERSVTDVKVTGTIESVENACDAARGNLMHFDVYTENVPSADAGSAWVYGKRGTAAAFETALHLTLRPGIGHSGGTLNNANLLDLGAMRLAKVSGYSYLYKTLLKTTATTERVLIDGLDTDNIAAFSTADGIADFSKITLLGFTPRFMTQVPGGPFFIDAPAKLPALDFFEVETSGILPGQFFTDAGQNGKLRRRDKYGNFSAPIGALRVTGTSGWTVQGGRLAEGEVVQNAATTRGEPGLWISTRYSKDVGNDYTGCSTTAGSPVITNATVGTFFQCEVGDYVTVSAGFADANLQRRVIARSADLTSITLDSNATSTVSGTVAVSTESHKLIPLAQQGAGEIDFDPNGVLPPKMLGEEIFRTDTNDWYKSTTGPSGSGWKRITYNPA